MPEACFASSWVWIELVASRYPSVVVETEDAASWLEPFVVRTREAVRGVVMVPLKVGEARGAFASNCVWMLEVASKNPSVVVETLLEARPEFESKTATFDAVAVEIMGAELNVLRPAMVWAPVVIAPALAAPAAEIVRTSPTSDRPFAGEPIVISDPPPPEAGFEKIPWMPCPETKMLA